MYAVEIANKPFEVKEYKGKRVVTFKDVDTVHGRADGTASRNFKSNRKHFVEGEDFYVVKPSDVQKDEFRLSEINNRGTTLLTESGYLMLVKSFTDDLAWDVQRQLVKYYFRAQETVKRRRKPKLIEEPYVYYDKNVDGEPVLEDIDLAHMFNVPDYTIRLFNTTGCRGGKIEYNKDVYYYTPDIKCCYYYNNPNIPKKEDPYCIHAYTLSGVMKIMEHYGTNPYALYHRDELNARMLRHMGFEFDITDMLAHVAGISGEEMLMICKALRRISEHSDQKATEKLLTECTDIILK